MQADANATQFCGSCGHENPAEAVRCVNCSDLLDPTATTPAAPTPPFELRTAAIVGAVAALLVVVLHVAGLSFSMRLLPGDASHDELLSRVSTLVDDEVIDMGDGGMLTMQLWNERQLREELRRGELTESEAAVVRDRVPEEGRATVLGVRGLYGLLPLVLAFVAAAAAGTALARERRSREAAVGLLGGALLQVVLWLTALEFDVGALLEGRLIMVGPGPAFTGGPVLLLVVSLVFAIATATGVGYIAGFAFEQAQGKTDCPHCGHFFTPRKGQHQCPSCTRPLQVTATETVGVGGMTRAQTGAEELLCVQCAKTYAADACPLHPREPLLDPRREDVRPQLIDLDSQAGTHRFARWTEGLGTRPEDTTEVTGGVCMECAKAYDRPTCPVHPDEPLLDPSREEVRLEMGDADDRRRNAVGVRLMFLGFGLAATFTVGLTSTLDLDNGLSIYVFAGAMVGLMAVARVLTPALSPPRYGQWTGAEGISRDDLASNARNELLAPVRRWAIGALAEFGKLMACAGIGAVLGALLAFGLAWPLGLGAIGGLLLGLVGFVVYINVKETGKELRDTASSVAAEWRDPYA